MIGEAAFKGFCKHAEVGAPWRALFITPTAALRNEQQLDMINMAEAHGLMHMYKRSQHVLLVEGAEAYLRIAHDRMDEALRGMEWHFIHGLEYLDAFPEGRAISANLQMRVRL